MRYHILCLSQNNLRFLSGESDSIQDVPLDPRIPRSLEQSQKRRLSDYVEQVCRTLEPLLMEQEGVPLIPAMPEREAGLFRRICQYPYVTRETISETPDRMTARELQQEAGHIIQRLYLVKLS